MIMLHGRPIYCGLGILPMTSTNLECIPMFSFPRTRPPPVSSSAFFVFPITAVHWHWRATALRTQRLFCRENSKSSSHWEPSQHAIVSHQHPEKNTSPPLPLKNPWCSSVCVPEKPQKATVNVSPLFWDKLLAHRRPIWNVGYPHTPPDIHKHSSLTRFTLD